MSATVELDPMGFVIIDDFGPEGRRPVYGFNDSPTPGKLIFHSRPRAEQYASARNAYQSLFAEEGYCENEFEARAELKSFARTHGRVYVTQH